MNDWPQIFFARHGETSWNLERRYQGRQDIPLNETGKAQADATGVLLADLLRQHRIDPAEAGWYASPLSRAAETMARMRAAFDVELPGTVFDDRLVEISFGVMEGKLHRELPPDIGIPTGLRPAGYWDHRPPEGESYQDVAERLLPLLDRISDPAIIVAHGGVLRVLRHLIEKAPKEEVVNWPVPQGTIAHFRNGRMSMHHP